MCPRRPEASGTDRRDALTETETGSFARGLRALVPQRLARAGLAVGVETDRDVYDLSAGEEITVRVTIANRLPWPVAVETDGQRIWGWRVDGLLAASEERLRATSAPNSLELGPRESLSITRTWDGRFKRVNDRTYWERAAAGEHTVAAFVATASKPRRAATTIRLR